MNASPEKAGGKTDGTWAGFVRGPRFLTRRSIGGGDQDGIDLTGDIPVALFPRLVELGFASADSTRTAVFRLHAHWDSDCGAGGCIRVTGEAQAMLRLICQRCLEPMSLRVGGRIDVGIVRDEDAALHLPPETEPMIETQWRSSRPGRREEPAHEERGITVLQLVEEELLLAAPVFPLHPGADGERRCKAPGGSGISVDTAPEDGVADGGRSPVRDNPFAVLARLKKEH